MDDSVAACRDFAEQLNTEVRERAALGEPYSTELECFASNVLTLFEEAGVVEDPEVCVRGGTLGRAKWEIAGWAFPPSEEEDLSQLSVLAVLFHDDPEMPPASGAELRRRGELGVHFIREMLAGRADELEPAADAAALGRIIHERRHALTRVQIHLATDGMTQRLREIEPVDIDGVQVTCSIWDIERLSRLGDAWQEDIEIDVPSMLDGQGLPCLRVPEEDPHYDAYLCVVPGVLLYKAYEQYGQRLLELNVRSFLSGTNKVNKGIRETIRTTPERFFPYNNGLALTARSVELRQTATGHSEITRIVGLQVVNGGQTTVSIHRAWKLDKMEANVRQVFVQGKLTVITTAEGDGEGFVEMVRSISKFANSQSAVRADDLEANQPWHILFEKLSRAVWTPDAQSHWFYERARGSYSVAKAKDATTHAQKAAFDRLWPRRQLITKVDLAKAVNAWNQQPQTVSLGSQKNFKAFMHQLGTQVHTPRLDEDLFKHIIGQVIVLREATKLVRDLKNSIPAFRANVVAYLVSYLSFRLPNGLDFKRIWEQQEMPSAVRDTLSAWAEPIYDTMVVSAGGRNLSEWSKKDGCWEAVKHLDLSPTSDLDRHAATDGTGKAVGLVDAAEAGEISECTSLTLEEWDSLLKWGHEAENLHWKVQGIINTLRSYALQGWKKPPSVKQARSAAKAIRSWKEDVGTGSP